MEIALLQPHLAEHIVGGGLHIPLGHGLRPVQSPLSPQGFLEEPSDGLGGIQAAVGILKYHLGPDAVMPDFPLDMAVHTQNRLGKGGLAAAALPHQPQAFPGIDLEIGP